LSIRGRELDVISPRDAWVLASVLHGEALNGELDFLPRGLRRVADCLIEQPDPSARSVAWQGVLAGLPDADDVVAAVASVDWRQPIPEAPTRSYATFEDIAKLVSGQTWVWNNWIASAALNAIASDPGVGKTRLGLDIARRLWFKLPFPDGQENPWPEHTRTLWVPGDRNFREMLDALRAFGLPEGAVALGSTPDDPTGGLDLDDAGALNALGEHIQNSEAALALIDTVGMVTARNLGKPEEAREFFAPLLELAGKTGVGLLGLTHLSANKEALGRRIVEKARVVLKMTHPDPKGEPDRRCLCVTKTAWGFPKPLGVTMATTGNEYNFTPPVAPAPGKAPEKLDACKVWLAQELTPNPARVTDLRDKAAAAGFSSGTLYRAKALIGAEEIELERRKWWRLNKAAVAPGETA
jgi:hypothetical protein